VTGNSSEESRYIYSVAWLWRVRLRRQHELSSHYCTPPVRDAKPRLVAVNVVQVSSAKVCTVDRVVDDRKTLLHVEYTHYVCQKSMSNANLLVQ